MENRFAFKDFVLFSLVVLLILVVWLGMKQLDRQWSLLQTIQQQGTDQTRILASIERTLQEGINVNTQNGSTTTPTTRSADSGSPGDPFENLKEAEKRPDFARGDWLIDNFATKLPKITPVVSSDLYADWVQGKVIESLAYRDPDTFEYRPQLAKSWQISDDGLTFTFQLRKGVRFSDGQPFTADDVIYSFDLIMNSKINAPRQRAYYQKVKKLEKRGDYEVVFTMGEPYFESFDLCSSISVLPKHFYSKFSDEEINTNPGLLMGTGAYKMPDPAGWRPGQKVELVRNETYWGEPGPFNRIVFLEVQEEAAEETMFGNGELDVYATQPEQYRRLLNDPKTTGRATHFEFESPMNGYYFIAWNEKRKGKPTRFADPRVRRAMTMLTDRDRICKDVYLGYAATVSGPFAAGSPQADPAIKSLPYDPEAAKKLLAEAGFQDRDGSGVLKGPNGEPFRFKLTYGSGNATFERVVLFLKDNFAKAGITMEPDPVDWPILMKDLDNRDFDAVTLGWGGGIESDLYQEFDSSQMADQGDNFMSYSNPKLDELVREARRTVDEKKRMELWHKAHAILHEDQPYTFLNSRMSLRFMDKRIQNVRRSKLGLNYIYRYTMPLPWYVPKSMQKYTRG
jgi:peptide/nickel transport system substrate-binding protein